MGGGGNVINETMLVLAHLNHSFRIEAIRKQKQQFQKIIIQFI